MPFDNSSVTINQVQSPLEVLYGREKNQADKIYLTQPTAQGTRTFTWSQTMNLARKVAARIESYRYP